MDKVQEEIVAECALSVLGDSINQDSAICSLVMGVNPSWLKAFAVAVIVHQIFQGNLILVKRDKKEEG